MFCTILKIEPDNISIVDKYTRIDLTYISLQQEHALRNKINKLI